MRHRLMVTKGLLALVVVLSALAEGYRIWRLAYEVAEHGDIHGSPPDEPAPNFDAYYLVFTVGKTPVWALWTFFTTCFVELRLLSLIVTVFVLWTGGRYCELVWLSRPYFLFVGVVLALSNAIELTIYAFVMVTGLVSTPPHVAGCGALVMGIAVALKQLISEHEIVMFRGKLRVRLKWAPLILLSYSAIASLLGLSRSFVSYVIGFLVSWVYLRFFQNLVDTGTSSRILATSSSFVGDASDPFAFTQFFPASFQPLLRVPVNLLYTIFTATELIPLFTHEQVDAANQRYATRLTSNVLPLYQGARTTNERRKFMLAMATQH